MFLTYDEAMGRFRGSNARDPQTVAAVAAGLRSTPNTIKWAAIFFLIPSTAATLTIIGAIIGIPMLIACGVVISKAGTTQANIQRAQAEYTRLIATTPPPVPASPPVSP